MTPQMQALTLVEFALGNWSRPAAVKAVPGIERLTEVQLTDLAALAEVNYRHAEHVARELLEEVNA